MKIDCHIIPTSKVRSVIAMGEICDGPLNIDPRRVEMSLMSDE